MSGEDRLELVRKPPSVIEMAAKKRNAESQSKPGKRHFDIGLCWHSVHGVPRDPVAAVARFIEAAERGDPGAQNDLGCCYAEGKGVARDYTEAAKWFARAAGQEKGEEPVWLEGGKSWGITATEPGVEEAENNLGMCYVLGRGVPRNPVEGVKWLRKSAYQGLGKAQWNLGVCCERGYGVTQDYVGAARWYSRPGFALWVGRRMRLVAKRAAKALTRKEFQQTFKGEEARVWLREQGQCLINTKWKRIKIELGTWEMYKERIDEQGQSVREPHECFHIIPGRATRDMSGIWFGLTDVQEIEFAQGFTASALWGEAHRIQISLRTGWIELDRRPPAVAYDPLDPFSYLPWGLRHEETLRADVG